MVISRPPMGWNSWNTFTSDINEKLIMETADAMAELGMPGYGYDYLVIDDCWSERERNAEGRLVADPEKFPHGMKHVADYVHSKGLKFGMYSCAGTMTCARFPGSYGHEFADAETFAQKQLTLQVPQDADSCTFELLRPFESVNPVEAEGDLSDWENYEFSRNGDYCLTVNLHYD